MANLGIIDADPSEPPCNEEVIRLANRLLGEFNIPTTIEGIEDICAALFVLLYENLFSDRLTGIIRQPVSKEDEIHNCQIVIDVLSSDIVRDSLSHIRGIDIVEGDITAISNLLDIFSYLLDYVANRIESDVASDNEDHDSHIREKERKSNRKHLTQHSKDTRSLSSRSDKKPLSHMDLAERAGRRSPGANVNDNNSGVISHERYYDMTRPRATSPYKGDNLDLESDYPDVPPSPIRPDQSQSLMGQKTIDSTDLDSQFGKDDRGSKSGSPVPKVAWEDRPDLDEKLQQLRKDVASIGGAASSTAVPGTMTGSSTAAAAAPTTLNGSSHRIFTHHLFHHYDPPFYTASDLETNVLRPRDDNVPYLSSSMPPPKHTTTEDKDNPFRSTVGPIDYHLPHTIDKHASERNHDPTMVKGLSSSYNDLRHLVERTAAMTRVALQTSPIMGRRERDLNVTDTSDRPRPAIPSDGVRLARELNARGMRRGEPFQPQASPNKHSKKVAFSSFTDRLSDRHRYPLEELSDNDFPKDLPRRDYTTTATKTRSGREPHYMYDDGQEHYKSRSKALSPDQRKRTKKVPNKTEAFASHLARSRQPELGAAHLKLKTEDRAIKKKQEFLQRLYQEDMGEFSEDVRALLDKDYRSSNQKELEMLKSYKDSKPLVNGAKKSKSPSKTVTCKKPKLGSRAGSAKRSSSAPRRSVSPPLKLESEEDLLPFLLDEFPHLHLSDHTWHELCRKGLHQIEAVTRVYQESKRKKSRAQIQLEEAAERHEILSDIMRKELDHTKRLRDIKEQKTKQLQMKNKTHEKRVQSVRARRYYNEYQVRARSKQLKRRTREEMVFRDLFKDAIKIQKERIKDIRGYASDQRKSQKNRRQNEMESLENYYQDQFKLLAEKVSQERKDTLLRDKAQHQMVDRIKQELRKKIESEICLYQEQLFRDDDDAHFRQMDADRIKRQLHMARYAAQI